VNEAYRSGMIFSVIDEKMGSYPSECIEKFVALALHCCQKDTDARPSMAEVVKELDSILRMMPESDFSIAVSTDNTSDYSEFSMTSMTRIPSESLEYISGSDLASGMIPTIAPR
ncbi:hypothetical protein MKW94_001563, partial [Papaver nudicaule]|nr:hypothetical protein [Papaver nudicaule]